MVLLTFTGLMSAQETTGNSSAEQPRLAKRIFQILVENEREVGDVQIIYDKNLPNYKDLVIVYGDCYIVHK